MRELPASADLVVQLRALLKGEHDWLANTANFAAFVFHSLPQLNWAGFYFLRGNELLLGPFQGKPARVRIAVGRGVCGACVERGAAIIVPDVDKFPGHIACDGHSRSELVIPVLQSGTIIGVFDLDSPVINRFRPGDLHLIASLLQELTGQAPPVTQVSG
jgi:GAF domain-containing protein